MRRRTLAGGLGCFMLVALAAGQQVVVTSLHTDGSLHWAAPSGTICRVEWTGTLAPTATWARSWNPVQGLRMTGTAAVAVVPMFYRVVCDTNPPVLATPYVSVDDMHWVRQAYSATPDCPWGFEHDGIDFEPLSNGAPFQAVCDGTITDLVLRHAPDPEGLGGNWDVYVELQYDSTWAVGYNFEPKTTNLVDGVAQLTNLVVSLQQPVSRGDLIGRLYQADPAAHVHVSVWRNGYMYHEGVNVPPEPFFAPDARESVSTLLQVRYPGAHLTY